MVSAAVSSEITAITIKERSDSDEGDGRAA